MTDVAKPAAEPAERHMHCACGGPRGEMRDTAMPRSRADVGHAGSALDILDERFARGEIDKPEYLEKKRLISQRTSVSNVDQSHGRETAPDVGEGII